VAALRRADTPSGHAQYNSQNGAAGKCFRVQTCILEKHRDFRANCFWLEGGDGS